MPIRTHNLVCVALLAAALLAGCEVGPNYKRPKVKLPSAYGELRSGATTLPSQITAGPASLSQWWKQFHDPELNSLIARALHQNLDLQQAESRIRQARYQRIIANGGIWPEVEGTAGYQRARGSKNIVIPPGAFGSSGGHSSQSGGGKKSKSLQPPGAQAAQTAGGSASAPPGGPVSPLGEGGFPGVETNLYQAGFDAAWELDIFGGTRRGVEAANADLAASIDDRRAVLVSLLGEVADTYINLRELQQQQSIARQNLVDQQQLIAIIKERRQVGMATDLNIAQQNIELSNTAAMIPPLQAGIRQSIHALGILLGDDPDALLSELSKFSAVPTVPPRVPAGIPSQLLYRRPDIRSAERRLAAATARIGVAKAELFPQFSITGSIGLDSSKPARLLDWSSRYFLISPGITWPILDAGQIRGQVSVQRELARQALISYRQSILKALSEVDDAIANYRQQQLRRASLLDAVAAARDAVSLSKAQYHQGLVDFLTVLDSERSLLSAQNSLSQNQQTIDSTLVSLYKALGGGQGNRLCDNLTW